MKCHECGKLFGDRVFGSNACQQCTEAWQEQLVAELHTKAYRRVRERHAAGRCFCHIPAGQLPATATDDDIALALGERLACYSTRQPGGTVQLWGEM